MAIGGQRGPKPLTARDWLFGSRPRRLAVRFVLNTVAPAEGWTKTDLAISCEVTKNGGISGHVDGLVALGLLEKVGDRYRPDKSQRRLRRHLNALLDELDHVPDERLEDVLLRQVREQRD